MRSFLECLAWRLAWRIAFTLIFAAVLGAATGPPEPAEREAAAKIAVQILRADYEADLAALRRLHGELEPYTQHKEIASRVYYWRGFAMWRRALNSFNLREPNRSEIMADLNAAVAGFTRAYEADPAFADAKIAAAGCMMSLAFLHSNRNEPGKAEAFIQRFVTLGREARQAEPDNPRILWVAGGSAWWAPPEAGGSQTRAMEIYERGLAAARKQLRPSDALEPSWGEPELLMSLAWANLNRTEPDLDAAQRYANEALVLVPYWHYVKNILVEQIRAAREKGK